MEIESDVPHIPDHKLSEKEFLLTTPISAEERGKIFEELTNAIKSENLAP